MEKATPVKMVLVGDGCVGKTCMLVCYTQDKFPEEYVPTVFENYSATLKINNKMISLGLWDTAGQEEYAKLRTLAYSNCDIFVIVFDVTDQASFKNALNKWMPELEKLIPSAIKLIVGNKTDLRKEGDGKHVQKDKAEAMVKEKGGRYMECSARTQEGLKAVFEQGIISVLKARDSPKKGSGDKCCLA
jgi:Ras-related C3 botulinum toxin substrate 1